MSHKKTTQAVRTQMPSGRTVARAAGRYDANKSPFDAPHDTGTGGIPLKFFDESGPFGAQRTAKTVSPAFAAPPNAGLGPMPTTRRFPFGGK